MYLKKEGNENGKVEQGEIMLEKEADFSRP